MRPRGRSRRRPPRSPRRSVAPETGTTASAGFGIPPLCSMPCSDWGGSRREGIRSGQTVSPTRSARSRRSSTPFLGYWPVVEITNQRVALHKGPDGGGDNGYTVRIHVAIAQYG